MTRSITTNIKPNILITKRDKLTAEITRSWRIIATENVVKKVLLVIMIYEHY